MEILNFQTLAAVSILLNLVLIIAYFYKETLSTYVDKNTDQARQKKGEEVLENSTERGFEVLHSAIKKAQAIIGQAELKEIEITAASSLQTKKLEQAIGGKIAEETKKTENIFQKELDEFTTQIRKAELQYTSYLASLQSKVDNYSTETQTLIKSQIANFFEKFEDNLTTFLTDTEQRAVSSIDLEMRAARQLIDTYKEEQLKLIDENIVAMLERTLNIVLAKKLTLKDQVDLVYEALEKAKAEKFIV